MSTISPANTFDCRRARQILRTSTTASPDDLAFVRHHLLTCDDCAEQISNDTLVTLHEPAPLINHWKPWRRWALGICGALQLVLAIPWLFGVMWLRFDHHAASAEHLTRDGALGVIAGFAALFVLVRRNYARAMTAVVAAGVLLQILLGIIDDHDHHVEISFELLHVLIIGILVLLVLAWPRFVNLSTQNSNAKK